MGVFCNRKRAKGWEALSLPVPPPPPQVAIQFHPVHPRSKVRTSIFSAADEYL